MASSRQEFYGFLIYRVDTSVYIDE